MDFPITFNSQEEFDKAMQTRLDRAKRQWEEGSGLATAQRERDEAKSKAERAERDATARVVKRDARQVLASMNVKDPKRQERIIKNADLSKIEADDNGDPKTDQIEGAFKTLYDDVPELFGSDAQVKERGADSGDGSGGSGEGDTGAPLTRQQVESMTPQQINEPGMWERVQKVLSGSR